MPTRFTNWSGSLSFTADAYERPRGSQDVVDLVRRARQQNRTVRPVGSGHSSTPLVATDDILLSVDDICGVTDVDTRACRATVLPGTGLADLGAQLWEAGASMENLGDVDYQSIVGAIGTGTHGTGVELGSLSSTLVGGTLVTGTGSIVRFGEQAHPQQDTAGVDPHELLRAARVGLGALGVLTSLTLQVRPAYRLQRQNWMTHIDWVLEHFTELSRTYRHVDFYWYPRSDLAQVRILDEPGRARELVPPGQVKKEALGPSHHILPNQRDLKFDEMEYMLPVEAGLDAFIHARRRIKQHHRAEVGWRVLVRTVAGDDGMLSTTPGPTMTIALLHNVTLDYHRYFSDMEPLFVDYGGRPHWGKKHSMTATQLRPMYPEWDRFAQIRHRLDPDGVFLNHYLRTLLGVEPKAQEGQQR